MYDLTFFFSKIIIFKHIAPDNAYYQSTNNVAMNDVASQSLPQVDTYQSSDGVSDSTQ